MLESMRRLSDSMWVKAMFVILVASFLIFEFGSVFEGKTGSIIASIEGGEDISRAEFESYRKSEISRIQRMLGTTLSDEQLQQLSIDGAVLNKMITTRLLDLESQKSGIRVGDSTAVEYIRTDALFQGEDGKFQREKFDQILAANHLTEGQYIKSLKNNIAAQFLVNAVNEHSISANILAPYIYNYNKEVRNVDILLASPDKMTVSAVPSKEKIEQYYQEHQSQFTAPEHRSISYLNVMTADLMPEIKVSHEDAQQAYEDNIDSYQKPESRTIYNVVFDNKAQAEKFLAQLKSGADFLTLAKELYKHKESDILMRDITEQNCLVELRDNIFKLKLNEVSPIVESSMGVHVLKLKAMLPARTIAFSEVKDSLIKQLAQEKAQLKLFDLTRMVQDEIASGASFDEVGKKFKLVVKKLENLDNLGGRNIHHQHIPLFDNLVKAAFETEEHSASSGIMLPDSSGFFVVMVDKITPAKIKELAEVKEQVVAAWRREEQKLRAQKIAQEAFEALNNGASFHSLAAKFNLEIKSDAAIKRLDQVINSENMLPADFVNDVFSIMSGKHTAVHHNNYGVYLIGLVKNIVHADPKSDEVGYQNTTAELQKELSFDVAEQYLLYLRNKYTVKIYN